MSKASNQDWYKTIWDLDIKNSSWVEDTENQVDFIIKTLQLTGKERILDLACGFGRHCLSFAKRGYQVIGVDITEAYIKDAKMTAEKASLSIEFIHADIRDINFSNEFDVVLNIADGAIGYLENDGENLKIFDKISNALKLGGKHFMDLINAEHIEQYAPRRGWEIGEKAFAISLLDWDKENRKVIHGGWDFTYGLPTEKPDFSDSCSFRVYTKTELQAILNSRNMQIIETFSNYYGKTDSMQDLQLIVYSAKK